MNETLILIASFLSGSIPFGLFIGKLAGKDVLTEGSCNIGATNVWRVCGWRYGIPVFLLDALKGAVPVFVVRYIFETDTTNAWLEVSAGLCAILGHCFSPFLRFRGGKGMATAAGATVLLLPYAAFVGIATFACVFVWKKYASLGSLSAVTVLLLICIFLDPGYSKETLPYCLFVSLLCTLAWWTHRTNIGRLLRGEENKMWRKSEAKETEIIKE